MNFKRIFTLGLAFVTCFAFTGCELVSVNTERDNAQIILEIGDKKYNKEFMNYLVSSQLSMSGASGITQEEYDIYAGQIVEAFAKQEALKAYAVENGYKDKLTSEQIAKVDQEFNEAKQYYETGIADEIKKQYEDENKLSSDNQKKNMEKEVEENKQIFLKQNGISNIDEYRNVVLENYALEAYQNSLEASVAVNDQDVQSKYEQLVKEQKSAYNSDPSQYLADVENTEEIVVYVPAGFRRVKQVLIKIDDGLKQQIDQLNQEIQANSSDSKKVEELNKQLQEVKDKAYASIKPKADEVLKKAKAGENFDSLIKTYNQDEGMKSTPDGYLVHEKLDARYVDEFQKAAMSLSKVGDVSDLVQTEYGYHVLMYASNVNEQVIPLETYKTRIKDSLIEERKNSIVSEKTNDVFDKYKQEGKLKLYTDRMKTASVPGK